MTDAVSWRVDSVARATPAGSSLGSRPLDHPEWVRLLMGDFLAPARLTAEGQSWRVDYLVTAREVAASTPESVRAAMRQSVADDFEFLLGTLRDHRERIARVRDGAPGEFNPTLFLDAYELLMAVTVSDDPAHWLLAEDGLCVVRWGLKGPGLRPLLTWTDAEVLAMRRSLEARAGALPKARTPSLRSEVLEELSKAANAPSAGAGARPGGSSAPRASPAPGARAPVGRVAPSARARAVQWTLASISVLLVVLLVVGLVWVKRDLNEYQAIAASPAEVAKWKTDSEEHSSSKEKLTSSNESIAKLKTQLAETKQSLGQREYELLQSRAQSERLESSLKDEREAKASSEAADRQLLDEIVVKLLPDPDHVGLDTPKSALGVHVEELLEDHRKLRALDAVFGNDGRGSGSVKEMIVDGERLQPLIDFLRDQTKRGLVKGDFDPFVRGIESGLLTASDQQFLWGKELPGMEPRKDPAVEPWKWRIAQSKGTDGATSWYLTESDNTPPPPGGDWADGYPREAPWQPSFEAWSTLANDQCPREVAAFRRLQIIQGLLDFKGDGKADIPEALREFLARDLLTSMGKHGFEPQVDRQAKLKEAFKKPYDGKGKVKLLTEAEAPGLAQVRDLVRRELKSAEQSLKRLQQDAGRVYSARVYAVARDGRIRDMLSPKQKPDDFDQWEVFKCDPKKGWSEWKSVGIVRKLSVGDPVQGIGPDRVFLVAMKPIAETPQGATK